MTGEDNGSDEVRSVTALEPGTVNDPPLMLYLKPHHAHRAMGEAVDADFVELDRGNPLSRIRTARRLNVGDRPIITEGGKPLFQAAWMRIFGNCGPVIHLAADETLMNIFESLDHYSRVDRWAHRWAHRFVDAVLAVSPRLTAEARIIGVKEIRTIHPFPTHEKWDRLGELEPDFESPNLIAVGSAVPKNNFGALESIVDDCDHNIHIDVVGPRTEKLDSDGVTGHGFVDEDRFYELYAASQCFVLPARSQAFPVSTLEALRAGFPSFVTPETGTQPYVGKVHPRFVDDVDGLAAGIDWFMDLNRQRKAALSEKARRMASFFDPDGGVELFRQAYWQVMDGYDSD